MMIRRQAGTALLRWRPGRLGVLALAGAALLLGTPVLADEREGRAGVHPYHAPPPHPTASQRQVRGLLRAQREGVYASHREQYLSGPVQHQIYQRYLDSFSHRIPERYASTELSD